MTVDLIHVPISPDAWCALIDHAVGLGDKCEVDYLELKGTLSFAPDKRWESAGLIAKALLGMSNRMPESAALHLGGYGVVLVGIADGKVTGAESVDGAVLHDALEQYLGQDGPGWQYAYVQHNEGLVLAVVAHPPKWGDRQHTLRKQFGKYHDGVVFVRVPGKSRPATSTDISNLEERRARSSSKGASLSVEFTGTVDRVDQDQISGLIWDAINRARDELLFDLHRTTNPITGARAAEKIRQQAQGFGENRTQEAFQIQVSEWYEEASRLVDLAVIELLRHELAVGHFRVTNTSPADIYLSGVHVEVMFPPRFLPLAASDTSYHDDGGNGFDLAQLMPRAPKKWGTSIGAQIVLPDHLVGGSGPVQPYLVRHSAVEATGDSMRMSWDVGDLPGRRYVTSSDTFAVITSEEVDVLGLRWEATARGLDYVFEGQTPVAPSSERGAALTIRRIL